MPIVSTSLQYWIFNQNVFNISFLHSTLKQSWERYGQSLEGQLKWQKRKFSTFSHLELLAGCGELYSSVETISCQLKMPSTKNQKLSTKKTWKWKSIIHHTGFIEKKSFTFQSKIIIFPEGTRNQSGQFKSEPSYFYKILFISQQTQFCLSRKDHFTLQFKPNALFNQLLFHEWLSWTLNGNILDEENQWFQYYRKFLQKVSAKTMLNH